MRDIESLMRVTDPARDLAVEPVDVPRPKPDPVRWRPPGQVVMFAVAMLSSVGIIVAVLFTVPGNSTVGQGDYPYYSTSAQVEAASDTIVLATAASERNESYEGFDYRVVTLDVQAIAKGSPGSTIDVKLVRNASEGETQLEIGHTYVLFLETYDSVPASTINPLQGAVEVIGGRLQAEEVPVSPRVLDALGLR